MIHAADYRKRAEDCAERANAAQDEFHRKNFQQLADMWSEMADKAESRGVIAPDADEQPDPDEQKALNDALATIRNA
jgi:hypothetical protein